MANTPRMTLGPGHWPYEALVAKELPVGIRVVKGQTTSIEDCDEEQTTGALAAFEKATGFKLEL